MGGREGRGWKREREKGGGGGLDRSAWSKCMRDKKCLSVMTVILVHTRELLEFFFRLVKLNLMLIKKNL